MPNLKKIGLIFGFLALVFFWAPLNVRAANTGLQISPVTFNFDIKPGETQTGKITITNRNDETMEYVMELEIFENSSETGEPAFTAVKPAEGVSTFIDWVKFPDGDRGSIEVGKSKDVNFTITLPENAEPGGHYGAIFAKQTKPLVDGGNQVGVAARVGALTLVSVPGKTTSGAEIVEFSLPKIVWQGPVNFKMRVKNTGNVHFDSTAIAQIKNLIGQPLNFELGKHTILPNNIRVYEAEWGAKYPFGYFKVTPTATNGEGEVVGGSAVTMIAIPLIIVIPVLVFILILIWLTVYIRKHVRIVK